MADTPPSDFEAMATTYTQKVNSDALQTFANKIGVSIKALQSIGIGHDDEAWTFPEYDASGSVIGIARRFDDGKKMMVVGSSRGLTYSPQSITESSPLLIVEGQSDTAAGIDLGFTTIGRPSAMGGLAFLATIASGRDVIVIGENDNAGREGANMAAVGLIDTAKSVHTIFPPEAIKDLRAWKHAGVTREEILTVASEALDLVDTDCFFKDDPHDEPDPLPEAREIFRRFPVECLPHPVAGFVRNSAKAIGCDPSFLALPALTALGATIGNNRWIKIHHGWIQPPIIWAVIIGESGALKSPAFSRALHCVHAIEQELFGKFIAESKDYDALKSAYDVQARKTKGGDVGLPAEPPEPPIRERMLVVDTTIEALGGILQDNPRGVLLARDELSGWFGGFNRYTQGRGGDEAFWLSAYDAKPHSVDRKSQTKPVYIPACAACITGGIQPGVLRKVLQGDNTENGLASRFMVAFPPERRQRLRNPSSDDEAIRREDENALAGIMERLRGLEPDADGKPVIIGLSDEAFDTLQDYLNNTHYPELENEHGPLKAVWSKFSGSLSRLALIIHYVKWAREPHQLANPEQVDANSIREAIQIIEWAKHEARRVYGMLQETEPERETRELVEYIARREGSISVSDLKRHNQRKYRTANKAREALQTLEADGYGRLTQPKQQGRGRPLSEVFTLNQSVVNADNTAGDTGSGI